MTVNCASSSDELIEMLDNGRLLTGPVSRCIGNNSYDHPVEGRYEKGVSPANNQHLIDIRGITRLLAS